MIGKAIQTVFLGIVGFIALLGVYKLSKDRENEAIAHFLWAIFILLLAIYVREM